MNYAIIWSHEAKKILAKWAKSSAKKYDKLLNVVLDIQQHPRQGIGHPEPLRGQKGEIYSRRITGSDRIIYRIFDDVVEVLIITLGGHYDDK